MTRKRRRSALIWWNHMRLPQARPCSSTTGGPSPASLTATARLPIWSLSIEQILWSFPHKRESIITVVEIRFAAPGLWVPAFRLRAVRFGGLKPAVARRASVGGPWGRQLRRYGAQKFFELAAQLGGRQFDLFGGREHGFRGAAGLGDAAGDFVERRRDRLGAGRGAGAVVRNLSRRCLLLLDRAGNRGGVLIDVVHPPGDVADRRHRARRRALHREDLARDLLGRLGGLHRERFHVE